MAESTSADGLTPRQRYYERHRAEVRAREDAKARALRAGPDGDAFRAKKRAYYAANAERLAAQSRESRRRQPDRAERQRAYNDAYYAANGERLKAARKDRNAARTEGERERQRAVERASRRAYREVNRALFRQRATEYARKRRAKTGPGVRPADWLRMVRRFDGRCAYCGVRPAQLEQDHVVPLSRGGRHAIGNVLPACRTCNAVKSRRLLVEWRHR